MFTIMCNCRSNVKAHLLRILIFLWGMLYFSAAWAQAPKQLAKIKLKNGNTSEGEIVEEVPGDYLKLKMHNSETKSISFADIERITRFQQVGQQWGFTTRKGKIIKKRGYVAFFEGHFQTGLTYLSKLYYFDNDKATFMGKEVLKNGEKIISLMTIHGFQFNPHLIVGAGFGFDYHADAIEYKQHMLGFPVFGFARIPLLNRWVSPFFDFRLGYIYRAAIDGYNFPHYYYFFDPNRRSFHGMISGISFGIQVHTSAKESLYAGIGPQVFYSRYRKEAINYPFYPFKNPWVKDLFNTNLDFCLGIQF